MTAAQLSALVKGSTPPKATTPKGDAAALAMFAALPLAG